MVHQLGFEIHGTWVLVNVYPSCTREITEEDYVMLTKVKYQGIKRDEMLKEITKINPKSNMEIVERTQ